MERLTANGPVGDPVWSRTVVISCEHASHRLPRRVGSLGLSPTTIASHVGWDPGAARIARRCARSLGCAYQEGRYSRLLIDLNRSPGHPKLIPRVSFGVQVPGNRRLSREEREARIRKYYRPYRASLIQRIETIAASWRCVHLGIHSFTPVLHGVERRAEIGVLYDPARTAERDLAAQLTMDLRRQGYHVRRNFPYRGTSDGLTTYCRRRFPSSRYLGIEIEFNQRLVAKQRHIARAAESLSGAIRRALARDTVR